MSTRIVLASLLVGGALMAGSPATRAADSERKAKDRIEDRAEAAKDKTDDQAEAAKDKAQNRADAEKKRIDQRAENQKDRIDQKAEADKAVVEHKNDRTAAKSGKETTVGDDVSDAWITTKLKTAYTTEGAFKNASIKVDTENRGHVRLQGTVPTEAARAKAVEVARATKGVRDVRDDLIVGVKK